MAAKVRELGGEPEVAVISDDSWPTDRITPEGREKRALRFSRRRRENWAGCSSSSSRQEPSAAPTAARRTRSSENPGPTPCRSLRYCNGCRQPFEQFKTI